MQVFIEFDCPYCTKPIKLIAEEVSPEKLIKCHCGEVIPAGVLYDTTTVSE